MTEIVGPAIGVGAAIFDSRGRVLLIRRARAPALGQWSLPGGKQRLGETLVEACCREVQEETGVTVFVGPIITVAERRTEGFHYVIIDFLARLDPTTSFAPRPGDDADAAEWVALRDLPTYDLVPGLARVIERAAAMNVAGRGGLIDEGGDGADFVADQ